MLKTRLLKIKNNDFKLKETESIQDYLEDILVHIGDLDSELRDDLIYTTFCYWIDVYQYFDKESLNQLTDTLISKDFLFKNIGYVNDDVFTRSFSVLTLGLILNYQKENPFLETQKLIHLSEVLLEYLDKEIDYRGYTEHGWAHSIAHSADAIHHLLRCHLEKEDNHRILTGIFNKLKTIDKPLTADEYERLATPIVEEFINKKLLSQTELTQWFEQFEKIVTLEDTLHKFNARMNVRHFIRSIYFRLDLIETPQSFLDVLTDIERTLNPYHIVTE
ncbi:MAG: DUF2785 domain-containing protein [Clostridiales bacterium]|nr:DUF2785 domain-containing protein [Clostridiales bacterium]